MFLESGSPKGEPCFSSISCFPTQKSLLGFTQSQQNTKTLRHFALSRFSILRFLSMPMYITSCLPSSFPFNKTYAVAVTKEADTKKQKGWVQDCLQLYHRVLWLLSWAAEGRGSLPTRAGPRKGQGLQTTRRWLWWSATLSCSSTEPDLLGERSRQSKGPLRHNYSIHWSAQSLEISIHPAGPWLLGWPHFSKENIPIRHGEWMTCLKLHPICSQIQRKMPKNPVHLIA